MFDVGDLPVLTFGNYVLKTGVTKRPLKLYVFYVFSKSKKHDSLCCFEFLRTFSGTLRALTLLGKKGKGTQFNDSIY